MVGMDVFRADAFTMTSLTGMVNKMPHKPNLLGQLGVFEPTPSRTRTIMVERRNGVLTLIPTTAIGAPPVKLSNDKRDIRDFRTVRLAKDFTLYAEEVQGIREFGEESELMQVQTEYARRTRRIRDDYELTAEHHRLGALQGILLDADGTTVIYDFFSEFGIAQPAAIDWNLDNASTDVRQKCKDVIRIMSRAAEGAIGPGAQIHALCGDAFYDAFVHHANVEKFYINWQAAQELRNDGSAFGSFRFEGITFHNYRGTDDNSTVAIDTDECKFFPVGGTDIFKVAYAPAEFGPFVNTLGQELYMINVVDRDREAWTQGELYSYPLYMCQRPEVLQRAVRT